LIESSEVDGRGGIVLGGRRARHIREVLRAGVGDRLRIGMIRGPTGTGEIARVHADGRVDMIATWTGDAAPPPLVDLVLAVPRPKALARVLQTAACMGVRRIDLVNAWRVDKSYLHSQHLEEDALRHNLLLGCEQGGTTWLPELALHRLLMPFLRGHLAERVRADRACSIIAHPPVDRMIESVVAPGTHAPVIAAIGPEPGWIDREIGSFTGMGFAPVSLGRHIWRVETAVGALLAQLELLRRL
jgi:RsmE family RNA methyltransferase